MLGYAGSANSLLSIEHDTPASNIAADLLSSFVPLACIPVSTAPLAREDFLFRFMASHGPKAEVDSYSGFRAGGRSCAPFPNHPRLQQAFLAEE